MEGRAHQRHAKFLQDFLRFFREGRPWFSSLITSHALEAGPLTSLMRSNHLADADCSPEIQRGGDHRHQPQICHE